MNKDNISKSMVHLFSMSYEDCLERYKTMYANSPKELDSYFEFIGALLYNCIVSIDDDLQIQWRFDADRMDVEETDGLFSYMLVRMILERNNFIYTNDYTKTLTENIKRLFRDYPDKCTQCKYYRLIVRIC